MGVGGRQQVASRRTRFATEMLCTPVSRHATCGKAAEVALRTTGWAARRDVVRSREVTLGCSGTRAGSTPTTCGVHHEVATRHIALGIAHLQPLGKSRSSEKAASTPCSGRLPSRGRGCPRGTPAVSPTSTMQIHARRKVRVGHVATHRTPRRCQCRIMAHLGHNGLAIHSRPRVTRSRTCTRQRYAAASDAQRIKASSACCRAADCQARQSRI